MGSIPVGDSDIFFVPRLCQIDQSTFSFSISFEEILIFEVVLLDEFSEKKNTKMFRVYFANEKYNYS